MDEAGNLLMSIQALVVDTGARRIVVDTCIGTDKQRAIPAWTNLQTSFCSTAMVRSVMDQCGK